MRKTVIFLTILVFLACLGFGLWTSYKPDQNKKLVEGGFSPATTSVSQFQSNYLLIHVDNLQAENPKLVSVWGLIAYFPEPKLIFQALYPMPTATNDQVLQRYKLSSQKIPDSSWLRALADFNQITWDSYILVDDTALTQLGVYVFGAGISQDQPANPISMEQSYMQSMCSVFSEQGRNFLDGFSWKELIPDHFRTNVSLDFGLVNTDKLLSAGLPIRCEIFGN